MAKVTLLVVCAILLTSSVQGCSWLNIECKVKEFINQEASLLIGKAQKAFEQAMDHLFDDNISPLIDKAEAAIDAGIDKVDEDVNQTIDHIESSMEAIIHDAAQTANALASNVTHDIEEIIRKAASAMQQVESTFYRDVSSLLVQINQIVQKGQCMEAGGAKQIQDAIYKLLKSLNPYYRFSSCWRSLGFKSSMSLEDLTDIQLYNYQKECTLLNKITPNTPIRGPGGILQTYAQGQLYAAEYYCIGETAGSPAFQDVLSKEWLWWGVQYKAWNHTSKSHVIMADQVQQLEDDPCATPVECYAQAIKALKEAEQKILSIQLGLSNLNQTVASLAGNVSVNGRAVNTAIATNRNAITTNRNAIATNRNAIATNTDAITACNLSIKTTFTKLTARKPYLCNCKSEYGSTMCKNIAALSRGINFQHKFVRCCELCMGTAEEAAAYARENALPPAVDKKSELQNL